MGQKNLLFTWKPESFDKVLKQPDLIDLRVELSKRRPLSESLLVWKPSGQDTSWRLVDLKNEKFYYLDRNGDIEIEVSEETGNLENLPIPHLDDEIYATSQGFIDWLQGFKQRLDEYDLEKLKRTDLSERHLSFEIVHSHLVTVYEMFQEILADSNEGAVGLSDNKVQRNIQSNLDQFLNILGTVRYFGSSSRPEKHEEVLHQTFNLCDKIQRQLQQPVTWLRLKKTEQFKPQTIEQLKPLVQDISVEMTDSFKKENELLREDIAKTEKELAQLNNKVENEIAKESVSKHQKIFAKQAEEHRRASLRWLIATGGLTVVFSVVFYWLFEALKLGGTEWIGVLQNVFTKGFLLTLIYFVLNRSHKNYTAQKHLEVVNRHRQNALDTFDEFVDASGDNQETRDAVLIAATNAIFDANQSGYLSSKTKGPESANPIQQVIRAVSPGSSPTKPEN